MQLIMLMFKINEYPQYIREFMEMSRYRILSCLELCDD